MNTVLQRYKLPVNKQVTYTFYLSKQGDDLFDQSQFVQEDQADSGRGDVFYEECVCVEEIESDGAFIG